MTRGPVKSQTTPKPLPAPLAMSAASTKPTPSPIPIRSSLEQNVELDGKNEIATE